MNQKRFSETESVSTPERDSGVSGVENHPDDDEAKR